MERIGVFGGSFNPIHLGHLALAEEACEALGLSKVIFVPARVPPHKSAAELAPSADRLHMTRLAIRGNPHFEVSDMELRRQGPSYTIQTVRALRKRFGGGAELFFLIGMDTVSELPTWRSARELVRLCRFVPLSRPGVRRPDAAALISALGKREAERILMRAAPMPRLEISSSDIRKRIRTGRSARYLLPASVAAYVRRRGLYRSGA